jgi:hypothetical protein
MAATRCAKRLPSRNWLAETLTATLSPGWPASCQALPCLQAAVNAHSPSGANEPGLLGNRDKASRRHHAAFSVMPARQRLDADNPVTVESNQGLVVQHELVVLERPT